jgi:hypothetical protein
MKENECVDIQTVGVVVVFVIRLSIRDRFLGTLRVEAFEPQAVLAHD